MGQFKSLMRHPEPTEPRVTAVMDCVLRFTDQDLGSQTRNFSYSGIGVNLAYSEDGPDVNQLHSISIADIGTFEVIPRWFRGDNLGLMFRSKRAARPILNRLFEQIGEFPV